MHPPEFRPHQHKLSDWPDCSLEIQCCQGATIVPVRLLATNHGDRLFADMLAKLRCSRCRGRPAPVYLCAGHREHNDGSPAGWSIEIVPRPRTASKEV